jgi:hypothetical protein
MAVLGFVVGARTITDNSFLTHLATGRLILEGGAVPTTDPYSYAANGEPWTVQSWLVSLLYAVLDSAAGGWSIRAVNGALGAGIALGLWRLVAPARQLITRVGLVGLVVLVGTYLWPPRPLLFGLAAMVLVLQVSRELRPRWWLVPIFWFWANAHGSYVLGLVLLGAVMVGAAIDDRRLPSAELRLVAVAGLGCVAAVVNPLQWRLLWFPVQLLGRGEALDRVSEWASPSFRSPIELLYLLLLVLVVVAAWRAAGWRVLLPSLVFFIAGLLAVRNLGVAALVIVAMIAPSLEGLAGTLDGSQRGLAVGAVAVVALAGLAVVGVGVLSSEPVDLGSYPLEEIDWLEARSLIADDQVRIVQRDYVGNYVTLRYGRQARVFMDDRFDFHPRSVIDDHNGLLHDGDYAEIVARNRFDVVLWATGTPFHRWLETAADWTIVRTSDSWLIACRVTSPVYARCSAG